MEICCWHSMQAERADRKEKHGSFLFDEDIHNDRTIFLINSHLEHLTALYVLTVQPPVPFYLCSFTVPICQEWEQNAMRE